MTVPKKRREAQEAQGQRSLLEHRWLIGPVVSAAAHWSLLVKPIPLLAFLPELCSDGQILPTKESEPGEFNAQALYFEWLDEWEAKRTAYDKWGTRIAFVMMYGLPLVVFAWASNYVSLISMSQFRHGTSYLSPLLYFFFLVVSAQSCRQGLQPDTTLLCGRIGALAFGPCWLHSVLSNSRSIIVKSTSDWLYMYGGLCLSTCGLGLPLYAIVLIAAALIHDDQILGLCAVLAVYVWITTGLAELEWPAPLPEFECESEEDKRMAEALAKENKLLRRVSIRCMVTSLAVTLGKVCIGFSTAREALHAFTWGFSICGEVGYMMAVLVFASRFEQASSSYYSRQALAIVSISMVSLLGKLGDFTSLPALEALAYVSMILWLVSKQWDVAWAPFGLKLVMAYGICQYFQVLEPLADVLSLTSL